MPVHSKVGRGGRIRTDDFLLPKQALYQAELRPEGLEVLSPVNFCLNVKQGLKAGRGLAVIGFILARQTAISHYYGSMSKMPLLSLGGVVASMSSLLIAAPGQVTVTVESSPDMSAWSAASTGELDVSSSQPYYRAKIVPSDGGTPSYSDSFQAATTYAGGKVNILLQSGSDLTGWTADVTGVHDVSGGKKFFRVRSLTAFNEFVFVDASTETFNDFRIGTYEVTKEEWDQTYDWALLNGYAFSNNGVGCEINHPVHSVSWYDILKWCNARSVSEGRTPAYYTDAGFTTEFKTGSPAAPADIHWNTSANGYRLPTDEEWRFAAGEGLHTYSGSNVAADVAWHAENSAGAACDYLDTRGTWPVGGLAANGIGAYDMSGNVSEFVYDSLVSSRAFWGGAYSSSTNVLSRDFLAITNSYGTKGASNIDATVGFRLVLNIEIEAAQSTVTTQSSIATKPTRKGKMTRSLDR
jgi:sulfatase modifying factor 1